MTGIATLTGRFSPAVVTASPESKVNICEVFIVSSSATDVVPAPVVIFDSELPLMTAGQRKFPRTPVIRHIASPCQLPASRPAPGLQARKRAGRGKNPFLFAMLFEKNIVIFSAPNPSVLCVFSICPPPFRAWTGIGTAGAHHDAGLPDVAGAFYSVHSANGSQYTSGAFTQSQGGAYFAGGNSHAEFGITFRASNSNKTYGASPTVMPTSVDLPICLYLGNSA